MKYKEIRKLYQSVAFEEVVQKKIINTDTYKELLEKCNTKEDELEKFIGKDGYRKFEDFMSEYSEMIDYLNEEYFIKGFCKANKLRDEALMK